MSISGLEYLRHILDETRYLTDHVGVLTQEEFGGDETLKRAFVRSLEIIGEATKNIPDDLKRKYDHVKWNKIAGMRDRLIHGYVSVNYQLVWQVVLEEVPKLQKEVIQIIRNESSE